MNCRLPVAAAALLAAACSDSSASAPQAAADASTDVLTTDAAPADAPATSFPPVPPMEAAPPVMPCNGQPSFCERTYDALAFPTTHASMATASPPFACPAQEQPLRTQLDQGIRALDLEVHAPETDAGADAGTGLPLCLGSCAQGHLPLASALTDVRAFLDVNPREVVTLLVEGGADAAALASAATAAGLDTAALSHASGTPWPTLGQMIAGGQRLVFLADTTGDAPAWMLPLWSEVAETGRAFTTTAAMTCDTSRGAASAPLFLLNEFLIDAGERLDGGPACGSPGLAHEANGEPFFLTRAQACAAVRGAAPTFVSVDDYDDGDVFAVTRALTLP